MRYFNSVIHRNFDAEENGQLREQTNKLDLSTFGDEDLSRELSNIQIKNDSKNNKVHNLVIDLPQTNTSQVTLKNHNTDNDESEFKQSYTSFQKEL